MTLQECLYNLKTLFQRKNSMSQTTTSVQDEVAVGDLNSTAKGSGARKSGGKIKFSLIPLHLLAGTARVLMAGVTKYAAWNWAKGMAWSECFDCTIRHLFKWWYCGEDYDEETGEHHLDHVMCNVLFMRHYAETYKEGDDRPPAYCDFMEEMDWAFTKFDEEAYKERNGLNDQS